MRAFGLRHLHQHCLLKIGIFRSTSIFIKGVIFKNRILLFFLVFSLDKQDFCEESVNSVIGQA